MYCKINPKTYHAYKEKNTWKEYTLSSQTQMVKIQIKNVKTLKILNLIKSWLTMIPLCSIIPKNWICPNFCFQNWIVPKLLFLVTTHPCLITKILLPFYNKIYFLISNLSHTMHSNLLAGSVQNMDIWIIHSFILWFTEY